MLGYTRCFRLLALHRYSAYVPKTLNLVIRACISNRKLLNIIVCVILALKIKNWTWFFEISNIRKTILYCGSFWMLLGFLFWAIYSKACDQRAYSQGFQQSPANKINLLSLIFRKKGKAETERNEYANNAWSGKRAKQKVKRINLCSSATFCSGIFFKLKIVDKSLFCPSL